MGWCRKMCASACRFVASGLLLGACCWCARGDENPEVAKFFARHPDSAWRPFADKWAAAKASMTFPVENLMLPLEYYGSGRLKTVLRAKRSQMCPDGLLYAEDVQVVMLTESGEPDGRIMASDCLFDRQTKRGYCDGNVNVVKGTDRLKGRGMYFSIDEQFIKILSECEIRTFRIPMKLGRLS